MDTGILITKIYFLVLVELNIIKFICYRIQVQMADDKDGHYLIILRKFHFIDGFVEN